MYLLNFSEELENSKNDAYKAVKIDKTSNKAYKNVHDRNYYKNSNKERYYEAHKNQDDELNEKTCDISLLDLERSGPKLFDKIHD